MMMARLPRGTRWGRHETRMVYSDRVSWTAWICDRIFARILGRDPVDHPDGISKDAPSLLQWNFATLTQAKRAHATLKAGLVTCNGYVLTRPCVAHCIQRPLAYAQALLDRADAETRIRVFSVDVPSLKLRGRRHTLPEIGTP